MPRRLSEELTRKEMIDPQLEKGGWYLRDHSRVKTEIPLPSWSLQGEFVGVVARVESLRGRMSEAGRQVNGLFEALLAEAFDG